MLKTVKLSLEKGLAVVISAMLVILVCLTLWQVFTRYVLEQPALFTEELLRFSMIWMALLGAAYAFGTNQHLSLVFLKEKLKGKKRATLILANDLIVLFFSIVILFLGGIRACESTMDQFSPILRLPMGYVYAILPICAVLITVFQGLNMALFLKKIKKEIAES